jgi:hypothetical protein
MSSTLSEVKLKARQSSYNISSINDKLVHKFSYDIANISAIYNEYSSYGLISFNKIVVPADLPILNVSTSISSFISDKYNIDIETVYETDGGPVTRTDTMKRQFINEYLYISSGYDYLFIPYNKYGTEIIEYISPKAIENNTFIEYEIMLPIAASVSSSGEIITSYEVSGMTVTGAAVTASYSYSPIKIYDLTNKKMVYGIPGSGALINELGFTAEQTLMKGQAWTKIKCPISFEGSTGYNLKYIYSIVYDTQINSYTDALNYDIPVYEDIKWIYNNEKLNSSIYYMLYKDMDGINKIALCNRGTKVNYDGSYKLVPFSGSIASVIQMRSFDEASTSPLVFDYSITCN